MGEKRLCYGCMERKPTEASVCPICGYQDETAFDENYIAPGILLNNRYVVGVLLNHNSEGATYLGYNQSIGCKVLIREYMPTGLCTRMKGKPVISVIPQQVVQYKALMGDFTELNKSLAQMRSSTLINPTLDLFSENNTTYAISEYVEGVKLVDYLKDNAGELTWNQVTSMFPPFFTTLSLVHNNSIIHRAISPDTIYVTEKGELKLCAFCISSVRTVHTDLPCEMFHGYAAPEQYSPTSRQGTYTDVYGVCAVLYRILTGCKPTDAPSRMQNDNLCAPHEMNPNIPKHVSRVIMKGMSLNSEDRIQTVTELVTHLFEQPAEPEPKPIPIEPSRRQQQRRQESRRQKVKETSYDREDYVVQEHDNVIDRIKIPIIIGVLLICVLLVIAIVVLNLLDMGPISDNSSPTLETVLTIQPDTTNHIVSDTEQESVAVTGDSQMPDLVGKNYETKKQQLEQEGWLYLTADYAFSDKYKAGLIIEQDLKPGELFNSGQTVNVVVSMGPSSVILPEYAGKTLAEYEEELDALGMTAHNSEAVVNYEYRNGYVISLENHEAGEEFDLTGSETLKIYYASNPEPTTAPPPPPLDDPDDDPDDPDDDYNNEDGDGDGGDFEELPPPPPPMLPDDDDE